MCIVAEKRPYHTAIWLLRAAGDLGMGILRLFQGGQRVLDVPYTTSRTRLHPSTHAPP